MPDQALAAAVNWAPPVIVLVLMLLFAGVAFRLWRSREEDRAATDDKRYAELAAGFEAMRDAFVQVNIKLTGFITVDAHRVSMLTLHEKINDHSRKLAVLLDRQGRRSGDT